MQDVVTKQQAMSVIAANVRRLRGDRSYSEVAQACGGKDLKCYPATIQQIESAQHMPSADLISRLAEGLGVTPNDLLFPPKRRVSRAS